MTGWAEYPLNESMPWWALSELPRSVARAEFDRTMREKDERVAIFRDLLAESGIEFDGSDGSVQSLNDWFVETMTPAADRNDPDRRSQSVCEDVTLLLGDVMIDRHPELRWEFFTWGKKNVSYQSHVIMGFSLEDPKWHSNLGLSRIIYGYGAHVLGTRRGLPVDVRVPEGHPLHGVQISLPPLDRSEFLSLLAAVARRCQPRRSG